MFKKYVPFIGFARPTDFKKLVTNYNKQKKFSPGVKLIDPPPHHLVRP